MQTYREAIQFLRDLDATPREPFHPYSDENGIKVSGAGLHRMQMLLAKAGHPESRVPIINVAGTSGKGSTAKMLHCIYHAAGKTVGTFYSPYVTALIEQIEVNEQLIAPEEFAALVEWVKPIVGKVSAQSDFGPPSYFETLTLIALKYYRDRHCDVVILESGLGGTYDACNIAENQIAAVVSRVGLDHTEILGDTVARIARDKVGILRHQGRLFTASKDPAVLAVLEEAALKQDAIFFHLEETPHVVHSDLYGSMFGFGGITATLNVGGNHQIENACIAYAVTNMLAIDRACIEAGLARFRLPGRTEIIQREPLVILDGAHNPDKAAALVQFCAAQKIIPLNVVFGVLADKDAVTMLRLLQPITRKLYATHAAHSVRLVRTPTEIQTCAEKTGIPVQTFDTASHALDAALQDGPTLVTGSFALVGELRERWFPEEEILKRRVTRW